MARTASMHEPMMINARGTTAMRVEPLASILRIMSDHATQRLGIDGIVTIEAEIGPHGVRLVGVEPADGWKPVSRHPQGWWRRRRPSPVAGVTVADTHGSGGRTAEIEVSQDTDHAWLVARLRSWQDVPAESVRTEAGTVDLATVEGRLSLGEVTPAPGWDVEPVEGPEPTDEGWMATLVFRQGRQEVEILMDCAASAGVFDLLEVERRDPLDVAG